MTPIELDNSSPEIIKEIYKIVLTYEEELTRLLLKADAISSENCGEQTLPIREKRKQLVEKINHQFKTFETWKQQLEIKMQSIKKEQEMSIEAKKSETTSLIEEKKEDKQDITASNSNSEMNPPFKEEILQEETTIGDLNLER